MSTPAAPHPLDDTALADWAPSALIGGKWMCAYDGSTFGVFDPATGELLAEVPNLGKAETAAAIVAAEAARPDWAGQSALDRSLYLRRWASSIRREVEPLARLLVKEQGKPLAEARAELDYSADFIDWFAEEGRRPHGDTIPTGIANARISTIRQAIGVGACITPWNFPASMIARKAGPALAAGCPIIIKPSEQTPLIALALVRLAVEAGFPSGVINIVTGDRSAAAEIGQELSRDPVVRKISFTGSTAVGKTLMAQCAETVTGVALELGGNAPLLVFDDADIDVAIEATMLAKFRNAGQACIAANRILVQSGIHDRFVHRLTQAIAKLTMGNGLEAGIDLGPLIDVAAVEKVHRHVTDAVDRGATLVAGGVRQGPDSRFYPPTLLTDVPVDAVLCSEETFGPVAAVRRFDTEMEALALANDTPYGLVGYLFTTDADRVVRVSEALETGLVAVNIGVFTTPVAPFGGVKQSGIGREGGAEGLHDWQEVKYICQGVRSA